MQYTIRGIPAEVDRAIRARAKASGKSLNEVAVEALTEAMDLAETPRKKRDLSDIAGTYVPDLEFEAALADRDQIDWELWR